MNTSPSDTLHDTQSSKDQRNMVINKAGIKDLSYPLVVDFGGGAQSTVGVWSMYVGLPAEVKGTHMSRFVECLESQRATGLPLGLVEIIQFESAMRERLDGSTLGYLQVRFPYFMRKKAPVSGIESLLDYQITLTVQSTAEQSGQLHVQLRIPVKSLCPCSKTISDYGAHNQRSHIYLDVEVTDHLDIQELISIAEKEASSEIFGLLKRADEKWITERAYENPKFVEDLVRDLALQLTAHPSIGHFIVSAENFESIHNHSAFAEIKGWGKGIPKSSALNCHTPRHNP